MKILPVAPWIDSSESFAVPEMVALMGVTKMLKDTTRNPARFVAHLLPERHDFCVCRVRVACALTILETFDNLRTATRYMNRVAAHDRGSYVVFSKTSKQVVAKVTRTADA